MRHVHGEPPTETRKGSPDSEKTTESKSLLLTKTEDKTRKPLGKTSILSICFIWKELISSVTQSAPPKPETETLRFRRSLLGPLALGAGRTSAERTSPAAGAGSRFPPLRPAAPAGIAAVMSGTGAGEGCCSNKGCWQPPCAHQ